MFRSLLVCGLLAALTASARAQLVYPQFNPQTGVFETVSMQLSTRSSTDCTPPINEQILSAIREQTTTLAAIDLQILDELKGISSKLDRIAPPPCSTSTSISYTVPYSLPFVSNGYSITYPTSIPAVVPLRVKSGGLFSRRETYYVPTYLPVR